MKSGGAAPKVSWIIRLVIGIFILISGILGMIDGLEGIFGERESEEPSSEITMSEEEYRAACKEIDWKELCRYPDEYKGEKVLLEVQIKQIVSTKRWRAETDNGGTGWYNDDEYFLVDKRGSDAVKILEDDIVTVYGEFVGLTEITRSLTLTSSELPKINVLYADLVEKKTCAELYEEYAQKLRDATTELIEEFKKEAKSNAEGISDLAELCSEKTTKLAEIEAEGTEKMSSAYYQADETYDDYLEWSGRLWDVYMEEAEKITDAYMETASGQ